MILCDINVLVYAHRPDSHPEHARFAGWLKGLAERAQPFALSESVLAGFIRIVTNPAIFKDPTPLAKSLDFCDHLRERPQAHFLQPGDHHWTIFQNLCRQANARGKLVADAWYAALAMEHDCTWISTDADFARFPGLRWRHPLVDDAR